ncbi:MAG: ABC transporter ATP-binding protein [Capsulimonadaceae bacterium]|nr:ABC transporter ATP-binding protein [Capsulimonadaceae bacterium]
MTTLLSVENIQVSYGAIQALNGISITVAEGEIVTLIGANGAGKSTTLRAISGLVPVSSGRIIFEGRDITNLPPDKIVRSGIGHSPEGRRVFSDMSVRENLDMGAYTRKPGPEVQEDLNRALTLFPRLKERLNQNSGTLSGGEQQMLAIARALMGRPDVLLLDEPSLGLAPFLVRDIFAIIRDINRQGTTILLVEQNAHMALRVANRAYVLETGTITLEDDAAALLRSEEVRKAYLGE